MMIDIYNKRVINIIISTIDHRYKAMAYHKSNSSTL